MNLIGNTIFETFYIYMNTKNEEQFKKEKYYIKKGIIKKRNIKI